MNQCQTCEFWDRGHINDRGRAACHQIGSDEPYDESPAMIVGTYDEGGTLTTKADFGCTLWESTQEAAGPQLPANDALDELRQIALKALGWKP